VLQENIIVHAVKETARPKNVTVSSSNGVEDANLRLRSVPYSQVVSPTDPEQFIHLVSEDEHEQVRLTMTDLPASLEDLGLSVSTGRVVDFRARQHLRQEPTTETVPLIYPCHFNCGFVHWPKQKSRKPNAIVRNTKTEDLLVPAEVFVLTKRFSAKEERRRVVACVFDPKRFESDVVGFENHLNYFHCRGRGLPMTLALGLSAFLNSSLVDNFFRQFNGHTQVNATDLRSLRYPSRETLQRLGRRLHVWPTDQRTLDEIIKEELRAES
jgi:adenine-specific DNA-methyltransferase